METDETLVPQINNTTNTNMVCKSKGRKSDGRDAMSMPTILAVSADSNNPPAFPYDDVAFLLSDVRGWGEVPELLSLS